MGSSRLGTRFFSFSPFSFWLTFRRLPCRIALEGRWTEATNGGNRGTGGGGGGGVRGAAAADAAAAEHGRHFGGDAGDGDRDRGGTGRSARPGRGGDLSLRPVGVAERPDGACRPRRGDAGALCSHCRGPSGVGRQVPARVGPRDGVRACRGRAGG